jgi:DNA-binding IclR family transcriptional regulator
MLAQAMDVLQLFTTTRRELGVAEVAKLLGRSKSTVSGWMSAMHEVGLLDRADGGGPYRLGIRLAAFGNLATRSTSAQRVATPLLEQLTRRTRETSSLNVLIGSEVVNTVVVESPQPIHSAGGLGIPMPIHATAAGKVLVAWRAPEEVRHLLPLRLDQFTPETTDDIAAFIDELIIIRDQGYAVAAGELARDLFAISAPVRDSTGDVVAAMSITAPTSRISQKRVPQLAQDLIEMANIASQALGWIPANEEAAAD